MLPARNHFDHYLKMEKKIIWVVKKSINLCSKVFFFFTGATRPNKEKQSAPIKLISGAIFGTATANETQLHTITVLQKKINYSNDVEMITIDWTFEMGISKPDDIVGRCSIFRESLFLSFPHNINANVHLKAKRTKHSSCYENFHQLAKSEEKNKKK